MSRVLLTVTESGADRGLQLGELNYIMGVLGTNFLTKVSHKFGIFIGLLHVERESTSAAVYL